MHSKPHSLCEQCMHHKYCNPCQKNKGEQFTYYLCMKYIRYRFMHHKSHDNISNKHYSINKYKHFIFETTLSSRGFRQFINSLILCQLNLLWVNFFLPSPTIFVTLLLIYSVWFWQMCYEIWQSCQVCVIQILLI